MVRRDMLTTRVLLVRASRSLVPQGLHRRRRRRHDTRTLCYLALVQEVVKESLIRKSGEINGCSRPKGRPQLLIFRGGDV